MKNDYDILIKSNLLNQLYEKSNKEDFIGSDTKKLIEKCQLLLYYYPLKNDLIKEQFLADFYLSSSLKIRNTIYNFDKKCSDNFKKYYLNFIKISIKYFKLKLKHDYLYNNLNLEVVVNHSDAFEKEVIYDDSSQNSTTIATFKYKFEENEQQYLINNIDQNTLFKDSPFSDLFNDILHNKEETKVNYSFSHLDSLKKRLNKKSTRRSILLLLLTMPDAILENYVDEVAYIFSVNKLKIISLFSACRNLIKIKYERLEKYSQLNNKHYKNYLINHYKLSTDLYDLNQLKTSISWDKKAMIKNASKIRKTLNMHVSQRTLAKALDIKKGTVASSISAAKNILSKELKLS